jgi:peptidoglycan-associated lipoprotein
MGTNRGTWMGIALVVVAAGCSRNAPQQVTPQRVTDSSLKPAEDTAAMNRAADARRDSLANAARADSMARDAAARAHADSVRAEVEGRMNGSPAAVAWGLSDRDAAVMAEQVHFDFDRSTLSPQDRALLDQKLAILDAHPSLRMQIAGNCDERGPDEYNLALGERRAAAAKRYLVDHGVAADRVSIVSYGEERPLNAAHTEDGWAKNRRDDFVPTRSAAN